MSRTASRSRRAAPLDRRGEPGRSVCLLLTLLASIQLGCSGEQGVEHDIAGEIETAGANIILISIDSLRADHLQCYGYQRPTSPAIDALAADAILFERASSQAPWTLPSHASLLTSLYPRSHQATKLNRSLPRRVSTLASELKRAGYNTHAIVSGPFMQRSFGMAQGFDTYDQNLALGGHTKSHKAITSPRIQRRTSRFLDETPSPFFLFLHYWDVHHDYIPHAPYDEMFDPDYEGDLPRLGMISSRRVRSGMPPRDLQHLVALYDGEIRWVDHHIGLLLDELKER